jgi:hypothetical protein
MSPYQNLNRYINDLIRDKAILADEPEDGYVLSIDDLSYEELGELAALFLEYNDRDTSECFNDPTQNIMDDDITCALLKVLKDDNLETRQDLAVLIRTQTIKRFKNDMQDWINRNCLWEKSA